MLKFSLAFVRNVGLTTGDSLIYHPQQGDEPKLVRERSFGHRSRKRNAYL